MSDYIVNEGSTAVLTCTFKDENNRTIIPDSLVWRVDDADTGVEIVADTTETPTSYKHNVVIPNTANAIIDTTKQWERKRVTITFYYSGGYVGTEEFKYLVKNLSKVTS